jgi:uncharacterized protein YeaC (DUF1315 family)
MDFNQLIANITPEIYTRLKRAVEIGRWPDGRRLTDEQRELSLQAIIAWEAMYLPESERTGYIDRGTKAEGELCGDDHDHRDAGVEQPVKWLH